MVLVYSLGRYHMTVTTKTHMWHVSFARFEIDAWTRLDVSWQVEEGLTVCVNGNFVARSFDVVKRTTEVTVTVKNTVSLTTFFCGICVTFRCFF